MRADIVHIQYLVAYFEALGCWWMSNYWRDVLANRLEESPLFIDNGESQASVLMERGE